MTQRTWTHVGGGCVLWTDHPYPCDDHFVSNDGEERDYETTRVAHCCDLMRKEALTDEELNAFAAMDGVRPMENEP